MADNGQPVPGPGEKLCGCPAVKHVLPVGESEPTRIRPNGQRVCVVGRRRADNARNEARRKARAA